MPFLAIDRADVDALVTLLQETADDAEADIPTTIAAAMLLVKELAADTPNPDDVLDWAARLLD